MPGDRAEIDDHARTLLAHRRNHRLGAEELVLEVHLEAIVPIVLGDVVEGVAVVVGGVVDQYVIGAARLDPGRDRRAGRGDVGEIDMLEARVGSVPGQALRQVPGFLVANVEEGDVGALPDEAFDDAGADAGAASRHQDARPARLG